MYFIRINTLFIYKLRRLTVRIIEDYVIKVNKINKINIKLLKVNKIDYDNPNFV